MSFTENQNKILEDLRAFFAGARAELASNPCSYLGHQFDELHRKNHEAYTILCRAEARITEGCGRLTHRELMRRFLEHGFIACVHQLGLDIVNEKMREKRPKKTEDQEQEIRSAANQASFVNSCLPWSPDKMVALDLETAPLRIGNTKPEDLVMPPFFETPKPFEVEAVRHLMDQADGVIEEKIDDHIFEVDYHRLETELLKSKKPPREITKLDTPATQLTCEDVAVEEEKEEEEDDMDWDAYTGRQKNPNPMQMWEELSVEMRKKDEFDS